jgi:hypothetical protein
MVDRRNDQRLILNQLARTLRRHAGELGEVEIGAAGGRRFAVGDEVVARMGDRNLHPSGRPDRYVRNGTHGVITAVHPVADPADERITVAFHGLGEITLPRAFFDEHRDIWRRLDVGLDHAYAITSYAVEGLTLDESTSHVDPRSSRPEVYVDITRGRHANHVFVTGAEDLLHGERLPAAPTDPHRTQLEHRLTRSGPEHVAIAIDPLATKGAPDVLLARAQRIREHQIAHGARAHPDASISRHLGPRPTRADLARHHEASAAAVAVKRGRVRPDGVLVQTWEAPLEQEVDRDADLEHPRGPDVMDAGLP